MLIAYGSMTGNVRRFLPSININKRGRDYMKIISNEFLNGYPALPPHMNPLGRFVYYRTYSRYLEDKRRRETWKETVRRATEYNVGLEARHLKKLGLPINSDWLKKEAELLFDNMFNLDQFLSGRTLWVGGAENGVADKYPLANFNCSFTNIRSWDDLGDLFYLLLVGTGVGFKCTKEFAEGLAPVRDKIKFEHGEYKPVPKAERLEHTKLVDLNNGYIKIYVGDSKEGWVESLRYLFDVLTKPEYNHVHTVKFSYNSVRPAGERLKTFGGTASGHLPLLEMFQGIEKVIKNEIDPTLAPPERVDKLRVKLRPIHVLDIGNLIGNNVVVGGVRRTAEIFLFDPDDYECMFAKYGINGIWDEEKHRKVIEKAERAGVPVPDWMYNIKLYDANVRPLHHRRMSNNSIAFINKPSKKYLELVFAMMQGEGEPGFVNLYEIAKRRLHGMGIHNPTEEQIVEYAKELGMNPCAEILLAGYGVCNLTTVNVMNFVEYDYVENTCKLDILGLIEAQKLSARAGLRMTLVELELPHWNEIQKRDRLLGCSLTGWKDAMGLIGFTKKQEKLLLEQLNWIARQEANEYAKRLRVSVPMLVTTVKPEGTLSQVAGGVSSGLHYSHAPYYIRRIRINANDPLAKAVKDLGWTVNPEIGTPGETYKEKMRNARTLVIDFPVKSGAKRTKNDVTALEQLENYFMFQECYTDHNASNTITVRPHEWGEVCDEIYKRWDEFTAVSFLAHDGGTYELAPYEEITEEQYEALKASMKEFTPEILARYETSVDFDLDESGCENGVCPIR